MFCSSSPLEMFPWCIVVVLHLSGRIILAHRHVSRTEEKCNKGSASELCVLRYVKGPHGWHTDLFCLPQPVSFDIAAVLLLKRGYENDILMFFVWGGTFYCFWHSFNMNARNVSWQSTGWKELLAFLWTKDSVYLHSPHREAQGLDCLPRADMSSCSTSFLWFRLRFTSETQHTVRENEIIWKASK